MKATENKKYIFDVDGTLTPSRQKIDKGFADFFEDFCQTNHVYLVTGSDRNKTREQLTYKILKNSKMAFQCAGNEVYQGYDLVYKNEWLPEKELVNFLEEELNNSKFNLRTGKHIEFRPGMINFSIIGRNCDLLERQSYVHYDRETDERRTIAKKVKLRFPEIDVFVGGETGLDIFPLGYGKEQCVDKIRTSKDDKLIFFGDQVVPGGNDYDIAMKCDRYYHVKSWRETYEYLSILSDVRAA